LIERQIHKDGEAEMQINGEKERWTHKQAEKQRDDGETQRYKD
jgi:hypothetical protein